MPAEDRVTDKPWKQCDSSYRTRSGFVFCTKEHGHTDEHRGPRKRWPNERSDANRTDVMALTRALLRGTSR